MRARTVEQDLSRSRLLGIKELQSYTGVGRTRATQIGRESNAIVHIGKRVLFDRKKIDQYIDSLTE